MINSYWGGGGVPACRLVSVKDDGLKMNEFILNKRDVNQRGVIKGLGKTPCD